MKISILGTGVVGRTIAQKMTELGHEVYMGTRNVKDTKSRDNEITGQKFADWHEENASVNLKAYADLPSDTDIFINASNGKKSYDAIKAVGESKFKGKTILDIANPLDSKGFPPSMFICNNNSLGEEIQKQFPGSKVVKSLNTMNHTIMVNPSLIPGDHSVFMSGNFEEAKDEVRSLLKSFGWKDANIIDMGDITTARGTEMLLPIWLRLYGVIGGPNFNFHIAK